MARALHCPHPMNLWHTLGHRRHALLFGVGLLGLAMVGCGQADGGGGTSVSSRSTIGTAFGGGGDADGESSGFFDTGASGVGTASDPAGGGEGTEGCVDPADPLCGVVPAGQLTAGEWRDLDHWDFWLELMSSEAHAAHQSSWGYETTLRVPVHVSSAGEAVIDARADLLDGAGAVVWTNRTDSLGRAELFAGVFEPSVGPYSVRVSTEAQTVTVADVSPSWLTPVEIEMAAPSAPATALDLMFVIDTTGSMWDELSYIQAELADVIRRARAESVDSFALRSSFNFYRDEGDAYVVHSNPFTADDSVALSALAAESAGGGGDWPEAVDQAMHDAIFGHEWSQAATARLLFLVLDAPPHETPAIMARLREANREAAARGVKIIPLVGTGIDERTEFLMRFMAMTTNGTYVFLTDDSG
ncbi:MAG: VWA domain-containing protein, partial [Myxococcales bacterium]|nr:VWA domain-containing protein [Myxococcales bacterium]